MWTKLVLFTRLYKDAGQQNIKSNNDIHFLTTEHMSYSYEFLRHNIA